MTKKFNIKEWQQKHLLKEHALGELPSDKLMKMKWNPLKESDPVTEDKGGDLADRVISNFRKALRRMTDDEVFTFREKIALAIDAKLKG